MVQPYSSDEQRAMEPANNEEHYNGIGMAKVAGADQVLPCE